MRECFGVPSPKTFGLCAEASFPGGTTGAHPHPRDLSRTWIGRSQSSGSCTTMARPSWNTSTASECGNVSSSSSSSSGTSGRSAGSGFSRAASYREAWLPRRSSSPPLLSSACAVTAPRPRQGSSVIGALRGFSVQCETRGRLGARRQQAIGRMGRSHAWCGQRGSYVGSSVVQFSRVRSGRATVRLLFWAGHQGDGTAPDICP